MSATALFDAGFTDLVSVVPPGADLAEGTTINEKVLGKVPGKKTKGGWVGYPFTAAPTPTRADAAKWDKWGANVGILGDNYPGVDIDCDDPTLAKVVQQFAERHLGPAPVRLSRDPRRLMVYRTEEPFQRIALVITYKGTGHKVEILGDGRQYLLSGKHPSGVDYRWDGSPLWEWSPDDLSVISGESALAWLQALGAHLNARGIEVELVGTGATQAPAPPQEGLWAPSGQALADLVSKIPNRLETRAEYVEMLYAIKAAGAGDEGSALGAALEWASRWEGGHNEPDQVERDWASLKGPYRIGWNWLQDRAQASGAVNTAQDEFEAVPGAVPPAREDPEGPGLAPGGDTDRVPYTDEWVVDQLTARVRSALRYVHGSRTWYLWGGHRWQRDTGMDHQLRVREMLRGLCNALEEQAGMAPGKEGTQPRAAARRYQSASGIKAVSDLLQAYVACPQDAFDRDPYKLNTPGGVVNLRTGERAPVAPEGMHARSTPVAPVAGPAPVWDRFLQDLTGGDPDLVRYIQKVAGYALTGDVSEKTLWFVWGSDADTGKSTFIRVLMEIMGDYADTVDVNAFIGSGRGDIPADLARLPGARLVTATEPPAGHAWDEKRIKAITGGDAINARFLYGQWFSFAPQFKILIVGNHEPEIRNVDDAMLRRIHIVPFNRKVPRSKQVENLSRILVEREGPQILQWIIDGCLAWQSEGLTPPEVVVSKTKDYERLEDTFGAWLEEDCEVDPEFESTRQELYAAWVVWCKQRGEDPGSEKTFKRKMEARKLPVGDCQIGERRLRGYRGIRLNLRVGMGTDE